jgi:hypothetical protein
MGIFADFLAHSGLVDTTEPQEGEFRVVYGELLEHQNRLDPTVKTAWAARDEVQVVPAFDGEYTSGNYTITITHSDGTEVTTANIAYNANAATIESALDTACNGNITSWTNGDISVSGGPLSSGNVTLTFDGDSVTEMNHSQTTIADVDLVGTGANASITGVLTNGNLTWTAPAVGEEYNDFSFVLVDSAVEDIAYDDGTNTFTLMLDITGGKSATQTIVDWDDALTANPTWPAFALTATGDGSWLLDAPDAGSIGPTTGGTDPGSLGTPSTTYQGQPQRYAWALMEALGLISTPPDYGELLDSSVTLAMNPGDNPFYPSAAVRDILARQAAIDDGNDALYNQLKTLFHVG